MEKESLSFLDNGQEANFLEKAIHYLDDCDSFDFSVSFIKLAGLKLLRNAIERALSRGARGRLITSTYQNFTDIPSLEVFLKWQEERFPGRFECHLDFDCFGENGFHTKGYLFKKGNERKMIIGSTNITYFALKKNIEWNLCYDGKEEVESYAKAEHEFEVLWQKTRKINAKLIQNYKTKLDTAIERWDMDYVFIGDEEVAPNVMQQEALKRIRDTRDEGANRALVVSAPGSGKTYLAAFDARNFGARRVLFVVHRDAILIEAMMTFQKVFGDSRTYCIYNGENPTHDADFVFASNTMVARHLNDFNPDDFDYIVMDECHHTSGMTYEKIMEFFEPEFMLGLTATPDRMDGDNVYSKFQDNVPYDLRLRDALLANLVVPFKYYGIRAIDVDYSNEADIRKIAQSIASNHNCELIDEEIRKHRPEGKLKAVAFCVNRDHAREMAEKMRSYGYKTAYLSGLNDTGERLSAFKDLQEDNGELEIIFAIDILNEGVDIPSINMVLFLRPTESSIIFLQQLGRGLRKYPGKRFLTVLDFIGNNYQRSTQIALALGSLGETSFMEKAYLREMVISDFNNLGLEGVEIHLDAFSKEEILKQLDKTNFNRIQTLKNEYETFKHSLRKSTPPTMFDYLDNSSSPDLIKFLKANYKGKNCSYYSFLRKIGESDIPNLSTEEEAFLNKVSDLLPLVRPDEYLIIKSLLDGCEWYDTDGEGFETKRSIRKHAKAVLAKKGIIGPDARLAIKPISEGLVDQLEQTVFYGLTRYAQELEKYVQEFGEYRPGEFMLYGNYYKEQVMMVLKSEGLQFMKGTLFREDGETILFVGLKKEKRNEEKLNYKDKFLSPMIFQWESENGTTMDNSTGRKIRSTSKAHLFVRKMESEDGITLPFTYFGTGHFTNIRATKNNDQDTLTMDVLLDNEVPKKYRFDFEVPGDKQA